MKSLWERYSSPEQWILEACRSILPKSRKSSLWWGWWLVTTMSRFYSDISALGFLAELGEYKLDATWRRLFVRFDWAWTFVGINSCLNTCILVQKTLKKWVQTRCLRFGRGAAAWRRIASALRIWLLKQAGKDSQEIWNLRLLLLLLLQSDEIGNTIHRKLGTRRRISRKVQCIQEGTESIGRLRWC